MIDSYRRDLRGLTLWLTATATVLWLAAAAAVFFLPFLVLAGGVQ